MLCYLVWNRREHKNFILYFSIIDYVLEAGGLMVLDEIDNDIHPVLMPEIIGWFHDERTKPP